MVRSSTFLCEEDGLVNSRSDLRVMVIVMSERVSDDACGEKFHSLETI